MPDGTLTDGGLPSNLFATLNAVAPTAVWQREFARALQTWADVTPLNFHIVPDNGAVAGSSGSAQGDSRFGDIRLGAYARTSYVAYTYYPGSGGTLGGDMFIASNMTWHVGTNLDLYSVLLHESGHAIGLDHSTLSTAVMYPTIATVFAGLSADDIAGAQAIYGARKPDAYDSAAPNNSAATATSLSLDGSGAVTLSADLSSLADLDFYRVTAPSSTNGNLRVTLDASQLSLFEGKVSVYDASGTPIGTASATTYGQVVTLNLTRLAPGQTYTIGVSGATTDVFGMGAYKLSAQFGGVTAPPSLSVNSVALPEGSSGSSAFTFTVSLSAPSASPVTVQYVTADGTATVANNDYVPTSGTLTFAPGQTVQTVTVLVNGDTVSEPNEAFYVNLSNPSGATLATSQGTGTIKNDDICADCDESNNTVATATRFGKTTSISQTGLTLDTASDVDDYAWTPAKNGNFTVTVTPTQGSGTVSVTLLNSQQAVVASAQSSGGAVILTASLSGNKAYYIRVSSPTGSLVVYGLGISKSGGGALSLPGGADEIGDGTDVLLAWVGLLSTADVLPVQGPGQARPGARAGLAGVVVAADAPVSDPAGMAALPAPPGDQSGFASTTYSSHRPLAADLARALGSEGWQFTLPATALPQSAVDDGIWTALGG